MRIKIFTVPLLFYILFANFFSLYGQKEWVESCNKYYCYQLPDNWRKLDRIVKPIYFGDTILLKEFRFTPKGIVKSGVLQIFLYQRKGGQKLDIKKKWGKDKVYYFSDKDKFSYQPLSIKQKHGIVVKGEFMVRDGDSIIPYYAKIWYIQGEKYIYRISFGSYSNKVFEKFLPVIEKMIQTFHEKE